MSRKPTDYEKVEKTGNSIGWGLIILFLLVLLFLALSAGAKESVVFLAPFLMTREEKDEARIDKQDIGCGVALIILVIVLALAAASLGRPYK